MEAATPTPVPTSSPMPGALGCRCPAADWRQEWGRSVLAPLCVPPRSVEHPRSGPGTRHQLQLFFISPPTSLLRTPLQAPGRLGGLSIAELGLTWPLQCSLLREQWSPSSRKETLATEGNASPSGPGATRGSLTWPEAESPGHQEPPGQVHVSGCEQGAFGARGRPAESTAAPPACSEPGGAR